MIRIDLGEQSVFTSRRTNLILCWLGIGASLLFLFLTRGRDAEETEETQVVLVASRAIPSFSGFRLEAFELKQVPIEEVPYDALFHPFPEDFVGERHNRYPIAIGEILTARTFVGSPTSPIALDLPPGQNLFVVGAANGEELTVGSEVEYCTLPEGISERYRLTSAATTHRHLMVDTITQNPNTKGFLLRPHDVEDLLLASARNQYSGFVRGVGPYPHPVDPRKQAPHPPDRRLVVENLQRDSRVTTEVGQQF